MVRLREYLEVAVEVINPVEQIRFHSCWGSGHRPHTHDIDPKYIVDLLLKVNAPWPVPPRFRRDRPGSWAAIPITERYRPGMAGARRGGTQ